MIVPATGSRRSFAGRARIDPRCTDSKLGQSQIAQAGYGTLWVIGVPFQKFHRRTPLAPARLAIIDAVPRIPDDLGA